MYKVTDVKQVLGSFDNSDTNELSASQTNSVQQSSEVLQSESYKESESSQDIFSSSSTVSEAADTEIKTISFADNQLYAVIYLGYRDMSQLASYLETYVDKINVPIYQVSDAEYYLIIPRYTNSNVKIYKNNMENSDSELLYEITGEAFVLQCNMSDIFADATVRIEYKDNYDEFSPYRSLKDSSVIIGQKGLLIS